MTDPFPHPPKIIFSPTAFFIRLLVFGGGWLILTGGQISDLWFVVLILLLTTALSLFCVPPGQWKLRPLAVLGLLPYFLITALRGGWDVARRAFYRRIPIDPGFITIHLDDDHRRTLLLVWIISLLPGTASCEIEGSSLIVHVLDKNLPVASELEALQRRLEKV